MEVVSKRVGGANYQVPMEVRPERKFVLAMRWIIGAARSKKGKPMADEARGGIDRGFEERGRGDQEKTGYASDGRSEPRIRAFCAIICRVCEVDSEVHGVDEKNSCTRTL